MFRDITTELNFTVPLLQPTTVVTNFTTFSTQAVNLEGLAGITLLVFAGALTGSDGVTNFITAHLQGSNDLVGAHFVDVPLTDMIRYSTATGTDTPGFPNVGQLTGGLESGILAFPVLVANMIARLGYIGTYQYLRIQFVFTGVGISSATLTALGICRYQEMIPHTELVPLATS